MRLPNRSDFPTTKRELQEDIVAGITVAIVALPLAIGFGITSGMSAAAGISTAIIAGFIAALFGGSRLQVSGPTGAMTVVLIPVIDKYGAKAIPALGVIAGFIVILMAIFRLGSLINRVPHFVIEGFTLGIAVIISLQQLPMALGVKKGSGERTIPIAFHTLTNCWNLGINKGALLTALITLIFKFNFARILKALKIKAYIPASFGALIFGTIFAKVLGLNVATIGQIPRSVAKITKPVFEEVERIIYTLLKKRGLLKSDNAPPAWQTNPLTKFFEDLFKDPKYAFLNPESRGGVGTTAGTSSSSTSSVHVAQNFVDQTYRHHRDQK